MSDFDSLNQAEFSYEKKSVGKNKLYRILLIIGYVLFVILFFLACYLSKLIPVFALSPIFTWMLVFFTWRYVSYDMYFEFAAGVLMLGTVRVRKSGRTKKPRLFISVKDALEIAPYDPASAPKDVEKAYDFSESPTSDKRIFILFEKDGVRSLAIFEGTARIARLLSSFSKNAHDLKNNEFHG